jgi:ATP-dependent Clp protease adaptor protein ClpS
MTFFKNSQTEIAVDADNLLKELLAESKSLLIYNDDYNTFDHVIESLIKVCRHTAIQAEQCALIIHNRGKCQVKSGGFEDLKKLIVRGGGGRGGSTYTRVYYFLLNFRL